MSPPQCDTLSRTSITFIMGEDNAMLNQYYTLAGYYYRLNREDRTEVVVDSLKALSQVLSYLQNHPPTDGRPYGLVNLVSHGNEFADLQMKVTPRGPRTSGDAIFKALLDGTLVPPDSSVVDSHTVVYLHGCAVGNNQSLLNMLARAFGERNRVRVMASKLFEYYAYLPKSRNPQSIRHYYARTWYAFYNPDSAFDEERLVRQLQTRYPYDTTHWSEGLGRRVQKTHSDLYHFSFEVPCVYEQVLESCERWSVAKDFRQRKQWLEEHSGFAERMAITRIPQQYFQMRFYRKILLTDDERLVYSLKMKARAGVVCLIQPLTVTDSCGNSFMPYCPHFADSSVFAFSTLRSSSLPGPLQCVDNTKEWLPILLYREKNVIL